MLQTEEDLPCVAPPVEMFVPDADARLLNIPELQEDTSYKITVAVQTRSGSRGPAGLPLYSRTVQIRNSATLIDSIQWILCLSYGDGRPPSDRNGSLRSFDFYTLIHKWSREHGWCIFFAQTYFAQFSSNVHNNPCHERSLETKSWFKNIRWNAIILNSFSGAIVSEMIILIFFSADFIDSCPEGFARVIRMLTSPFSDSYCGTVFKVWRVDLLGLENFKIKQQEKLTQSTMHFSLKKFTKLMSGFQNFQFLLTPLL